MREVGSQPITETQKFTSDVVWVAVSQVLMNLTGLVTLPALTKCYSTEIYGIWVQVGVTVSLLTPILTLHLGTAMVRFLAAEEDKEKRQHALSAMLWPILAFTCLVLVISLLLRQNLSTLLFASSEHVSLIPLTFLWASTEALFSFSLSYLMARGKIKRLSVIQLALATVKMTVIVTLATNGYSLGWIVALIVLCEAVFVATVFGMIIREIGFPRLTFEGLEHFLSFSVPQIPAGALLWVIGASDRYFITHLLDISQTGIYAASYTLGSLIGLIYSPVAFVLFPTLSRLWEQKQPVRVRNYLEYSTKLFLALAVLGAAQLYILSQPLLGILATAEYAVGGNLVLLVALSTMFNGIYQFNVYVILLVQQTKWLPLIIGVAAATNAGINIGLIPKIGMMGAAISAIVSCFILAAIVTVWARRAVSYKMDSKFLAKVIGAAVIMALCLRSIPTTSIWRVILAMIAGVAIFALVLWLLRAFSAEDRKLVTETLSGLNPRLWIGKATSGQSPSLGRRSDKHANKNGNSKENQ